jgi:GT2 family glycosyltransferase
MVVINTAVDKEADPRVFIVMPTYNRWDEARIALQCISQSTYRNFRILLVEDACSDGTAENCRAEFPEVEILHGNGDLWWSGTINKGVEYALERDADAIVWFNDDNRVEPETLSYMVESFKRQGARSIICARTKSIDTRADEWAGDPPRWHPEFGKWTPPDLSVPDAPVSNPPGGRGVLIPAQCFREIGQVDAHNFPHYWADYDFHYRAMRAGYKYFIATEAVVWNVPNQAGPEVRREFSTHWVRWFLFDRRSAMNMPTLRRLLKRHLPPPEYRKIFYPILFRHLAWLSYGWLIRKPLLHRPLRALKKSLSRSATDSSAGQ